MVPKDALKPPHRAMHNFFTVDVEEYFQVNAFDAVVSRSDWDRLPCRLEHNLPPLLDLLSHHRVKGTFFTLGWVAEKIPRLVQRIVAEGHELASHGFWHRRVTTLTPDAFREDLRLSRTALEQASGCAVLGYRAPSFSIVPSVEWAFDILVEEGFAYDSSVFPIRRRGYGNPSAPRQPYMISTQAGDIAEYPLATASFGGLRVPAAGGGYLRQFPLWIIRRAFRDAERAGIPGTFYIHPWEIDPAQPQMPVGWLTRIRHYRGLSRTLMRMDSLLREFAFGTIASALAATRTAGGDGA